MEGAHVNTVVKLQVSYRAWEFFG